MRNYKIILFVMGMMVFFTAHAQLDSNTVRLQRAVDSQHYVFIAQSALPQVGGVKQLTTEYSVKISKTTCVSYLPYFGRAYQAGYGDNKSPLDFISKEFEYEITPRKNDKGWEVTIKPKDYKEVQSMSLIFSKDGYATLQVISLNRQPISFTGFVTVK
jgi:hypothetical protein